MIDKENLSLDEVINVCKTILAKNIEIRKDNLINHKTSNFMEKYDFFEEDVKREIKNLTKYDYHQGPLKDRNVNNKHPLWVFIKHIGTIKVVVYIKIKIINHRRKIIVYSFHEEGLHDESK